MSAKLVAPEFERECFFITPIGLAGTSERKRADDTLRAIVEPSAEAAGLATVRADTIDEGGHITLQVLEHCINAKAAVADLTGGNLNVYYEVGIRHALSQPLVLIADESMREALPFDLLQQRTIFYTDTLDGAASARESVTQQLRRALAGNVDSPVQAAANLRGLQEGDAVHQTLAQLVNQVAEFPALVERIANTRGGLPPEARRELHEALRMIDELAGGEDPDTKLEQLAERLRRLLGFARPSVGGDVGIDLTRLRELRHQRGLTLEELAHRSNLDRSALGRIERGQWHVPLSTLTRIASSLDVTPAELVSLVTTPLDGAPAHDE